MDSGGGSPVWVSPVLVTKAKRQTHEYPQTLSNLYVTLELRYLWW